MKQPGEECTISYDGDVVAPGDALRTPTGRAYGVISVRVQTRGKHTGRQFVRCVVLDELSAATRVHPLVWYKRERSSVHRDREHQRHEHRNERG